MRRAEVGDCADADDDEESELALILRRDEEGARTGMRIVKLSVERY
jgi:hypothetical protein